MDDAQCVEYLLSRCPGFATHWETHRAWWGERGAGLVLDLAVFGEYAAHAIERHDATELAAICEAAERLVTSEDKPIQEAAVIGLLDGLMRRCRNEPARMPFARLVPHVGPATRTACRRLDESSGVRTPGLW